MKNKKFKTFILFLDNNKKDTLKDIDVEIFNYFYLTPEFNLSISPNDVMVDYQSRTKRTGGWSNGLLVSSDSKEKLIQHLDFIKEVISRHRIDGTNWRISIPNVVFLNQVSKKEIYSKIPGAVDIKFTDDFYPIPVIAYDDGTTQPLDCERLEKLTKIEHIVACADSTFFAS